MIKIEWGRKSSVLRINGDNSLKSKKRRKEEFKNACVRRDQLNRVLRTDMRIPTFSCQLNETTSKTRKSLAQTSPAQLMSAQTSSAHTLEPGILLPVILSERTFPPCFLEIPKSRFRRTFSLEKSRRIFMEKKRKRSEQTLGFGEGVRSEANSLTAVVSASYNLRILSNSWRQ